MIDLMDDDPRIVGDHTHDPPCYTLQIPIHRITNDQLAGTKTQIWSKHAQQHPYKRVRPIHLMDWRCCHEKIGAHEAKHGEEKDDVPGEFLDEVWDEKGSAEASRNEGKHLGGDSEGMGVASDIMEAVKKI